MPNKASNAVVGKPLVSGGILVAPTATAQPTNESTALPAAFKSVGFVVQGGVTRSEKTDTETKVAWGGAPLIVINKGKTVTAKLGLAEYLNPLTQQLIYGEANVVATAATSTTGNKLAIHAGDDDTPHNQWVIELFSGKARGRIVFPDAQITELDDVTFKDDDIAARPITLTLFQDASGKFFHEYWDDGQKTA